MPEIIHGLAKQMRELSVPRAWKPSLNVDWEAIAVGDGVKVDVKDHDTARVAAHRWGKRLKRKFKTTKAGDVVYVLRTA